MAATVAQAERRQLEFANFEEIVNEIQRLSEGEPHTIGNHSFPAIVRHLGIANDVATGRKTPPRLPFFMRLMMPFIKGSIVNGEVKPGFRLPSAAQPFFWPENDIELVDAFAYFKETVAFYQTQGPLPAHPLFGAVTRSQIEGMLMRHAAMHLSFVL